MERDGFICGTCFGAGFLLRDKVVRTGPFTAARRKVKCACPGCNGTGRALLNDPPAVRQDREEWAAEATFWR